MSHYLIPEREKEEKKEGKWHPWEGEGEEEGDLAPEGCLLWPALLFPESSWPWGMDSCLSCCQPSQWDRPILIPASSSPSNALYWRSSQKKGRKACLSLLMANWKASPWWWRRGREWLREVTLLIVWCGVCGNTSVGEPNLPWKGGCEEMRKTEAMGKEARENEAVWRRQVTEAYDINRKENK